MRRHMPLLMTFVLGGLVRTVQYQFHPPLFTKMSIGFGFGVALLCLLVLNDYFMEVR